jgi:hypothetical protein
VESYEWKVEELEKDKEILSEKITKKFWHLKNVWTALKSKLEKTSNPLLVWNSQNIENKKNLLKMIFPNWIPITKKRLFEPLVYRLFIRLLNYQKCLKSNGGVYRG